MLTYERALSVLKLWKFDPNDLPEKVPLGFRSKTKAWTELKEAFAVVKAHNATHQSEEEMTNG